MKKIIRYSSILIIFVMLFSAFWAAPPAVSAPLGQHITGVGAAWYHADWHYRRPVTVTNTGSALTDYQVLVTLDNTNFDFTQAQADGADLRVTAGDGTMEHFFWVESWENAAQVAWVWVRVPSLPTGNTTLYLYFGNATATPASDGKATFVVYDGFETYAVGSVPTGDSTNPGEWTRYAGNPVLTPGASGTWDATGATFASVLYDAEATPPYRMYYHGWGASPCGGSCVGLATSPDGLTWTKSGSNPVMIPTGSTFDANGVRTPMVWKEGTNDYRMIYTGSGSGGLAVGYATSTDGITWTKYASTPVFADETPGSWSYHNVENWGVIKVGTEYLMWYSNVSAPPRQSGIAVSTDLINWTPYSLSPIFASSGVTSDLRYSQFCPYTFVHGGYYYVLVPSYTSVSNYARYYLYRSSSPYFPTSDRTLVRVAHTVGASGLWDALDSDTPAVLTTDIQRSVFPGNQLWTYYAGAAAGSVWREGLLIETDIASALADTALPGGLSWSASGTVTVVNSPVRQGDRSFRISRPSSGAGSLTGTFNNQSKGVIGAWMRRDNESAGDFDIYLYGNGILAAVVGLGRVGDFHYWTGGFQPTGVDWEINTWYLVTIEYDTGIDQYNFVVYDQTLEEIVRENGKNFGNAVSTINSAMLYTSTDFRGNAYGDDFRLREYISPEPTTSVRDYSDIQETRAISLGANAFTWVHAGIDVTTLGSLSSVQIVYYRHNHPYAYSELQTGRYWEIIPNDGAADFQVDLTIEHAFRPDIYDSLAYYLGTGMDWNYSGTHSYDPVAFTVTRHGLTHLSEWAVKDAGPTAIHLKALRAFSSGSTPWLVGLAVGLVGMVGVGTVWYVWRKKSDLG